MGGDCRDTTKKDPKSEACPAAVTFSDVHDAKPKPKPTPPEVPLYLAQQVSGIPEYGKVAPIAKTNTERQAIIRQNEDHHTGGPDLPDSGSSPEEQARARAGAAAKLRGDRTRVGNEQELQHNPLGVLDAGVTAFSTSATTEGVMATRKFLQFRGVNQSFAADTRALAAATPGTANYARLQARVNVYDQLRIGKPKDLTQRLAAETEMHRLQGEVAAGRTSGTGFTADEIRRLKSLQDAEGFSLAQKNETFTQMQASLRGGIYRVGKGMLGASATYWGDRLLSANLATGGHDQLAEFMAPNKLEIAAMGVTWTAPVPRFVPGTEGPLLARLGARALWEGGWWLGTKALGFGFDKMTDPDVEKGQLDAAHQAQNQDHAKKTPDTMNAAIDAWRKLGPHNNQIQQALEDTLTQLGTTDPAKLAETRRDLAALYAGYGEARLDMGTRVGGPMADGSTIKGGPDKLHYILGGESYDFGGMAMYNLNTARNQLNELGISPDDPVAKRVYSLYKESDMAHIMNPHDNLPKVYGQLKDLVHKKDPDATWLSGWMSHRVADQQKLMAAEESNAMAAKRDGTTFVPQWNNYVLAKVYQDQALLDMAYAADGQDKDAHMRSAHDALKQAARLGWNGRSITVKGATGTRTSDLPELLKIYQGLGGTVDW